MNTDRLSFRLATVANYVPKEARLADIGSDHAYLPCYLAKNGKIHFAIAGEVAAGPYQSAGKNVLSEGLTEFISVRLGDGLEVIKPGEVDCITIAGMGGALITSIMEAGKAKLASVNRLILQPNVNAIYVRKWLLENNWELIEEEILEDEGKIYEILVAEKGNPKRPYGMNLEMGLLFGPLLLHRKEAAFKKKWLHEKQTWQQIYNQLESAPPTPETIAKKQDLLVKINMVKECLG